jgi:hypothetical protein
MASRDLLGLALLVPSLTCAGMAADFGPGEAAGRSHVEHADFKVVVWYRRDDALGTFKYQVYDVRKGEYTPAVETWSREVRTKYPAYIVLVRDVDLSREKGETESLKVGSVIKRDLGVAAGLAGIVIGQGPRIGTGPLPSRPSQGPRRNLMPGSLIGNRDYLNPAPMSFPVPVPYPHLPR